MKINNFPDLNKTAYILSARGNKKSINLEKINGKMAFWLAIKK